MKDLESYLKCSPKSPVRRKRKNEWTRGARLPHPRVLPGIGAAVLAVASEDRGGAGLSFLCPV